MRCLVVVIALLAGCRSGTKAAEPPPDKASKAKSEEGGLVPTVAVESALAVDDGPPPLVVILDEKGDLKIAAVGSWSELAKGAPGDAIAGDLDTIHKIILQAASLKQTPKQAMAELAKGTDELEPYVPSEDTGTGQAMALEEGKMTKKGAPPPPEDPAVIKRREAVPITGRRGPLAPWGAGTNDYLKGERGAKTAGEVIPGGKLLDQRAAIVASPRANAAKLIDAIELTEAAIVVRHGKSIRPLHINFRDERDANVATGEEPKRIEARLSATGVTLAATSGEPVVIEWEKWPIDQPRLEAAITNARRKHGLDPRAPVDVLVDPDITAQRLVDLLVALDTARVTMIGLGPVRR